MVFSCRWCHSSSLKLFSHLTEAESKGSQLNQTASDISPHLSSEGNSPAGLQQVFFPYGPSQLGTCRRAPPTLIFM